MNDVYNGCPLMPDSFLPRVGERFTTIDGGAESEALEAVKATLTEMSHRLSAELLNLSRDGCLHDASDNDRGVEEDAAFEATLDSLAPLE